MESIRLAILLLIFVQINAEAITKPSCGKRFTELGLEGNYWPWHAAIYHLADNRLPKYQCGATLITSNLVLTAGHCVSKNNAPINPANVSVSLGRLNLGVSESRAQSFEVELVIIHPNYTAEDYINNIAIVRLSTDATFNKYVQPICMWPSDKSDLSEVVDREGTVTGWGLIESGRTSNVLRQVIMPVVDSLICIKTNRDFYGQYLSETNFCAGFRNDSGPCFGDSGGSMTFEEDGVFYIRGIVSIGAVKVDRYTSQLLCDNTQYTIFTDVAQYLTWINEVVMTVIAQIK